MEKILLETLSKTMKKVTVSGLQDIGMLGHRA